MLGLGTYYGSLVPAVNPERGEHTNPLRLTTADFEAAVRELVEFGGALTRHLLGYRTDAAGCGLGTT